MSELEKNFLKGQARLLPWQDIQEVFVQGVGVNQESGDEAMMVNFIVSLYPFYGTKKFKTIEYTLDKISRIFNAEDPDILRKLYSNSQNQRPNDVWVKIQKAAYELRSIHLELEEFLNNKSAPTEEELIEELNLFLNKKKTPSRENLQQYIKYVQKSFAYEKMMSLHLRLQQQLSDQLKITKNYFISREIKKLKKKIKKVLYEKISKSEFQKTVELKSLFLAAVRNSLVKNHEWKMLENKREPLVKVKGLFNRIDSYEHYDRESRKTYEGISSFSSVYLSFRYTGEAMSERANLIKILRELIESPILKDLEIADELSLMRENIQKIEALNPRVIIDEQEAREIIDSLDVAYQTVKLHVLKYLADLEGQRNRMVIVQIIEHAQHHGMKQLAGNLQKRLSAESVDDNAELTPGGIDLNASGLSIQESGDEAMMFNFPEAQIDPVQWQNFRGLMPVIQSITPVSHSPLFSELFPDAESDDTNDPDLWARHEVYSKELDDESVL